MLLEAHGFGNAVLIIVEGDKVVVGSIIESDSLLMALVVVFLFLKVFNISIKSLL